MDDELRSEWFEKGESLADIDPSELEAEVAPTPNLSARFGISLAVVTLVAGIFLTVIRALA